MKNIGYSYKGFTETRLLRFLKTGGQTFTFIEPVVNEYGEPTQEQKQTVSVLGILHISNKATITQDSSVGSVTRTQPTVSIITSWESLVEGFSGGKELSPGMCISIDGIGYKVTKSDNLGYFGIAADISLEEYDGWKN